LTFLTVGKYTTNSDMMERIQTMGHTKYRKVRLGTSGKIQYSHTKRKAYARVNFLAVVSLRLGFINPYLCIFHFTTTKTHKKIRNRSGSGF